MKITIDQNKLITITFTVDEINETMIFQDKFELESPKPNFNDSLSNFRGRTVVLIKNIRTHFGVGVWIKRQDDFVQEHIWQSRIKDFAQVLRELETRGVVTVNRTGEGSHGTIRIIDFKFNY
jgi:hypothetical protein